MWLAVGPGLVLAQEARPRRIGFLYFGTERSARELGRYSGFIEGMRDSGYVLGKDFVLEARYGDGDPKWLAAMAAELVKTNVEVIVTGGTPANYAAQAVTQTIPIVITNSPDPVGEGFARSLARPGGNVTGFSTSTAEIDAKHVELLKASLPRLEVLAVLANPANRGHRARMKSVEATAQRQGAKTLSLAADTVEAIEAAFTRVEARASRCGGSA